MVLSDNKSWLGWVMAGALYLALVIVTLTGRDGTPEGKILLRFATLNSAIELEIAREQASVFEALHPRIHIRVEPITDQSILVLTAGRVPPDVFWMYDNQIHDLARGGATLHLDPLVKSDPSFDLSDFYPAMLPLGQYRGQLHALPRENGLMVMFYNRDMFQAAGVALPEQDWTWDDFLATAKALTRDTNGDGNRDTYGYVGNPGWVAEQHTWIWQNGGSMFNAALTTCTINEPAAVEAIQFFFVDLRKRYGVSPRAGESRGGSVEEFAMGRAGMMMGIRPHVPYLRKQARFAWDVTPLPYRRQRAALTGMAGYAISPRTRHRAEAWEFLKFLVSGDGLKPMIEAGMSMPPTRSLAKSDLFLKSTPPEHNEVFLDAPERGYLRPVPLVNHFSQVNDIVNRELQRAYFGEQTVQQACDRIKSKVDPLLVAYE
ncbi:MAG: sugar ABC transporter substrate-binding protein [Verrucomicrobia bacterium]|jgi:multiple sugar transport system substrate-binding protein|nr:sugar ABC transporter substrate-binding protein [Verrucomicrobiota bacterium]MBT7067254.1 sugar ABC transporter substrate-binding protein [Verrucomicrobiota bacterium]MBT7701608.1 sugar ABC transporter substrate-binding protein [Verrucomicrobiota bacterium]